MRRVRSPYRRSGQITGYLKGDLAEWFDKLVKLSQQGERERLRRSGD